MFILKFTFLILCFKENLYFSPTILIAELCLSLESKLYKIFIDFIRVKPSSDMFRFRLHT